MGAEARTIVSGTPMERERRRYIIAVLAIAAVKATNVSVEIPRLH